MRSAARRAPRAPPRCRAAEAASPVEGRSAGLGATGEAAAAGGRLGATEPTARPEDVARQLHGIEPEVPEQPRMELGVHDLRKLIVGADRTLEITTCHQHLDDVSLREPHLA